MGRFVIALLGVITGFVLAHLVNQTPEGRDFFARSRATLATFVRGFQDTFRA
jgi:hypothetical protein